MQFTDHTIFRRPGIKAPPLVGSGFKKPGFRGSTIRMSLQSVALVFQVLEKKRKLDIFAIIFTGLRREIKISNFSPDPRDQPPCDHGPITNVSGALAPFFSNE